MTPIAPDVVQSIATIATASSSGEFSRVPTTRPSTSPWTCSGR